MNLLIPCPRCGGKFLGASEFESHKCDDAVSRRTISAMPDPEELRARMRDAGTTAWNNASTAIDQAMRAALLSVAYLLLVIGRWLVKQEQEISLIHHLNSRVPSPATSPSASTRAGRRASRPHLFRLFRSADAKAN